MRNPYEAEPAEEPRVCATCARYFDFDRMCNVPEAVEKLLPIWLRHYREMLYAIPDM